VPCPSSYGHFTAGPCGPDWSIRSGPLPFSKCAILRLYSPLESFFAKTWRPSETWVRRKTKAKGEHWAKLKLSSDAIAVLSTEMAKWPGDEIWTYVVQRGKDQGKRVPITYPALRRVTDTAFKRANIRSFRSHDLRHTSKLLRLTGNLKLVADKLHHTSIGVTSKFYAHINDDELVAGTELVEAIRNSPGMLATSKKKIADTF
jgi:hypothetical protein